MKIEQLNESCFEVELEGITFTVFVMESDYERITERKISKEDLIKKSFEFLLERESKESILKEFNITDISKYFPEYEKEMSKQIL